MMLSSHLLHDDAGVHVVAVQFCHCFEILREVVLRADPRTKKRLLDLHGSMFSGDVRNACSCPKGVFLSEGRVFRPLLYLIGHPGGPSRPSNRKRVGLLPTIWCVPIHGTLWLILRNFTTRPSKSNSSRDSVCLQCMCGEE